MSDEQNEDSPPKSERRFMVRYPAKASTLIIRESDVMRSGLEAQLKDVSSSGLGIDMHVPLQVDERIKIQLSNEIQRIKKETRGYVRHVTPNDDGTYHIGIELTARLTPLEVSLLRMGIPRGPDDDENRWM